MTQRERVLEYLREYGSMTAHDGIRELGIIDSMIESGNRQKNMDMSLAIKLGNVLGLSLQEIVDAEKGE